jgi:hypothetical protein
MRKSFRKVAQSGFEIAYYLSRRSPKIIIMAGFMVISSVFLEPGFSQALNNFKPGSEPDGFEKIYWGVDVIPLV